MPSDVFVIRGEHQPLTREPHVVWAAPGSMFDDRLEAAWRRRGYLADIAGITGPWGVVLWDPDRGYLIATDPLGVQPVYWAVTSDGHIAVSSWLAKLVERRDVDDSRDEEGMLANAIHLLCADSVMDRTSFKAIRRVRSGRAIHVATRKELRYWSPEDLPEIDASLTLGDCVEVMREKTDQAIGRVLTTDGVFGAHVSGGVDSTAVACRANQLLRAQGRSLTAWYSWSPDPSDVPRFDGDERMLLDAIAAQEGLPVTLTSLDDPVGDFERLDPDVYPWPIVTYEAHIYPKARADGVTVMLNGFGGDEGVSARGRGVRPELIRRGRLDAVVKDAWQRGAILQQGPFTRARSAALAVLEALPGDTRTWRYPLLKRQRREQERQAERALAPYPALAAARRERLEGRNGAGDHREAMVRALLLGHLQQRMTAWYQRGRLYGIDYRYPLLDLDLLAAVASMPWFAFTSQGWSRLAFRLAIEPWVPAQVAWNPLKNEPARSRNRSMQTALVRTRTEREEELIAAVWRASRPARPAPRKLQGVGPVRPAPGAAPARERV